MKIALDNFEKTVDGEVAHRGRQYWQDGRVSHLAVDGNCWVARVAGRRIYEVELVIEDQIIKRYTCTCPYVLGTVCKHVVAVAYAIREPAPPGAARMFGELKLDTDIANLITALPEELRGTAQSRLEFYQSKRPVFTEREIFTEVKEWVRLTMLAYLDHREFLKIYNRRFVVEKAHDYAGSGADPATLGRVDFDLNGLKVLNDLGGDHQVGNEGLKIFSEILKVGETSYWLRGLGVKVIASAEGGDEFGLLLRGEVDLRPLATEIAERYFEEVRVTDVSMLVDFSNPDIRRKLKILGLEEVVPTDFRFELSSSVGVAVLSEVLSEPDDTDFVSAVNRLFALAHRRSTQHKEEYKKSLSGTNPPLAALYSRLNKEVLELSLKIKEQEDQITQLKSQLNSR